MVYTVYSKLAAVGILEDMKKWAANFLLSLWVETLPIHEYAQCSYLVAFPGWVILLTYQIRMHTVVTHGSHI